MKKILFFLLTALAITACNDDCNHIGTPPPDNFLVGSWYEETQNEEDTYSTSGTFYGRYCNTIVQGDGRGTYYYDSKRCRLTWSYNSNGTPRMEDWKLTNVSDLGFTMSSDIAILTYGKIVETLKMEGGETKQIAFNKEFVQGYESKNNNIATVTSNGLITATGEKGTAYIKIKLNQRNVWAKVVVGDDTPDLWIDYSYLLGRDFAAMKDTLGVQSISHDFGDYTSYTFETSTHNILSKVNVFIDNTSHIIDQIDLCINEGVTQEEILAYMRSHYYPVAGNYGNQHRFTTSSSQDDSRAIYAYDSMNNVVLIVKNENTDTPPTSPYWPNFDSVFGMTRNQVKTDMDNRNYTFYQSYDIYSQDGSDAYLIRGYEKAVSVEFVYNPDKVVSQYWIYFENIDDEYYLWLEDNYNFAENEYVSGSGVFSYYNDKKTHKVELNLRRNAIVYTDLTKREFVPVPPNILGNYWKGLGMSRSELISEFGEPYTEDDNTGRTIFLGQGDYVMYVNFIRDTNTGKVHLINLFLYDSISETEVVDYANSIYTFYASGTNDNGNYYKWTNAETDLVITYYPEPGVVVYQNLSTIDPPTSSFSLPDYTDMFGKSKTQVQEMIQSKGGSLGLFDSQVWYRDPQEDNIYQIWFDFNTTGDWKCNQIIFWLDMTDISESDVVDYLKSQYSLMSEQVGTKYTFEDNGNGMTVIYDVSNNKITLSI